MELVNRYVYAVTKHLPEVQREDVSKELVGLIEDMLEESEHKTIEEVLLELGDPRKLANKYKEGKDHLIGPVYYDFYLFVLKIAFISVFSVFTSLFVIQLLINPLASMDHFTNYLVSVITAIPIIVGWTTIAFIVIEHFKKATATQTSWKPHQLKPVPQVNAQIKVKDSVVGLVFLVILFVVIFKGNYLGVWHKDTHTFVSFIAPDKMNLFRLCAALILGFGLLKECLKLYYRNWTLPLVITTAVMNLFLVGIVWFFGKETNFWNPDFLNELIDAQIISSESSNFEAIQMIWQQGTYWFFMILLVGLVMESVIQFVKYNRMKKRERGF